MNRILLLGTATAIALVVGAKMAIEQQSDSALAVQSNLMLPAPSPAAPSSVQPPAPSPPAPALPSPAYYSQQIRTCAGNESNANFRAYPSLDPRAVLGVVAYGESVQLTGNVVQGDGLLWYEAIAPALFPSPDPGAQNRLEPNQVGWIASCFVSG